MKKKLFLLVLVLVMVSLVFAGCTSEPDATEPEEQAVVTVGYVQWA